MLKVKVIELHAEFWVRGRGVGSAGCRGCEAGASGARGAGGARLGRRERGGLGVQGVGHPVGLSILLRDVGPRKFLKKCPRGEGNRVTREMSACHSSDTRYCGDCSFGTQDLVFRGGRALHLVEARTGWRKPLPPTVPRPRTTWGERPRRVEHAPRRPRPQTDPTAPTRTTSAHSKHAETQKRQDQEHD